MPEAMLELAADRVIKLHDALRRRTFTLTCRRLTWNDWTQYFRDLKVTSEQQGNARVNTVDFDTPRKELAEAVLIDATGYQVAGAAELTAIPGWQTRIPLAHRLELGRVLADARPSDDAVLDPYLIHAEGEQVSLDATWGLGPERVDDEGNPRRSMLKYTGLKHILRTPSQSQYKRYAQQASRAVVVGGSRAGRTIYAGAAETLCELYDELIATVEGYSVGGVPLTEPSAIKAEMDCFHKFIAAQELFQPQSSVSTEDEAE